MELPLPQLPLLCFESSYPLSIHSCDSTIYSRHLCHHPIPFALTITQVQHSRMLMTDKPWSTHHLPQATLTKAFIYLIVKYRENKSIKMCATPSLHLQCANVRLSFCRSRSNSWSYGEKASIFLLWLQYRSPVSFPWRLWDFKQQAGLDIVTYQWNTEIWTKSHIHMEKKNHISRLRTITGNKSHQTLVQTSLVFASLDSTLCATQQTSKPKC